MNQSQEGYRVAKLEAERDALRAVNAELVEALTAITNQLERVGDTRPHKDGQFIDDAHAALTKAKDLKGTE